MRILFLGHLGTGQSSSSRRDSDHGSRSKRIRWVHDNFIGRSNALDDFDGRAEIATDFDVVEFNAVIGFHYSDL